MDRQHTPGPWSQQRNVVNYRSGRKALEIRGALDELVATLPGCERDAANAHIIAAAPELLAALENLLPTWMGDIERDTPGLAEQIRAAIAKARGEA